MKTIWILGTGPMGAAHLAALRSLGIEPLVVGRSEETCSAFRREHAVKVASGGIAAALSTEQAPDCAIIASPIPVLASDLTALIAAGTSRVLVEKPVALDRASIATLSQIASDARAEVFVGYNRRYYASVRMARSLIAEDGGVNSFTFDFTEVEERILPYDIEPEILSNWFIANSTHVVDTAFHLCGEPVRLSASATHALPWHPTSRFVGHGLTESGAIFAYHSDWSSAGRWGLEICTPKRRLILRPFERLQQVWKGTFGVEDVAIQDQPDLDWKPGLVEQMRAFLSDAPNDLMPLAAQSSRFAIYDAIRFGGTFG